MRGVILKETEILKDALNGIIDKKPMSTLRVLTKYYLGNGITKEEIEVKLDTYMKEYYKGYKPSKWKDLINQLVKSVSNYNSYAMCDVDSIYVTENEWFSIISLNNKQLEKLAFILLVYCKINKIKNPDCDNKINQNLTDILTESGIRMTDENKLLLNYLYKTNYISIGLSCNSTSIKLNYVEDDGDIKIVIDNFINVISYYDEYKNNKKYITCEYCKKRIVRNSKKPAKYCNKCSRIKQLEWQKNSMNKIRK